MNSWLDSFDALDAVDASDGSPAPLGRNGSSFADDDVAEEAALICMYM